MGHFGCSVVSSFQRSICYQAPLPPGYCPRCWFWKMSSSINGEQNDSRTATCFFALENLCDSHCGLKGYVTHPLARFSIPQYSSTSCLQGLETLLQPTSSDMSPQSSSPLHCRVLGIQRPGEVRQGWHLVMVHFQRRRADQQQWTLKQHYGEIGWLA